MIEREHAELEVDTKVEPVPRMENRQMIMVIAEPHIDDAIPVHWELITDGSSRSARVHGGIST